MQGLSTIQKTLFVPLQGRIYASEKFPHILSDPKAVSLMPRLPADMPGKSTQTQYTLLANAVRAARLDREAARFLTSYPEGVVVQLGAGLDTGFFRVGKHYPKSVWLEVDNEPVIALRRELLGENPRDINVAADALSDDWLLRLRKDFPDAPVFVIAGGFSYYQRPEAMLSLCRMLKTKSVKGFAFDCVSALGHKMMGRYMRQAGCEEAAVLFHLSSGDGWREAAGAKTLDETPFYRGVPKKGLTFETALTMRLADLFRVVKIVRLTFD